MPRSFPTTLALALSLLASALAGCLTAEDAPRTPAPGASEQQLTFDRVVNVSTRWPGAEPVVDVLPDGTVVYEGIGTAETDAGTRNVNRVWRSGEGWNWTDVTPPATGNQSSNDGYVAAGPDGAVYAANVFGLTFQVFKSTDAGDSWTPLNVPRVPALMHRHWVEPVEGGVVHVTVEALDPGAAPFLAGGPSMEDLPDSTANRGMYHFVSHDGGETWSTPQRIDPNIVYVGQSNMAVSMDGERVYVVRYEEDGRKPLEYTYEDGRFYLLASEDGGASWERREMFPLGGAIGSALTSLTMDPAGTLYYVWAEVANGTSRTHLAVSHDGGSEWSHSVLPVGSGVHAMPFAAARGAGELGVVWYQAPGEGAPGAVDAPWHVRAALITGADTGAPTGREARVTPWPVHEGEVCVKGPACGGEGDRRLLDYPWIAFGPDGRMHLAWSSTAWERPSAFPGYARTALPPG